MRSLLLPCLVFAFLVPVRADEILVNVVSETALRDAIDGASSGDVIKFGPQLTGQTITLTGGDIIVGINLTFDGSELSNHVTISGGGNSRVFQIVSSATVVFDSIHIAGGTLGTGEVGAGILNSNGNLTLRGVTVSGNTTGDGVNSFDSAGGSGGSGGGIYNAGTLTILDSTIMGNQTGQGGMSGFMFPGASGGNGAGIYNQGGVVTIENSTIANNTCGGGGNGITGGQGGSGGGIYNISSGTVTIRNSTITGNETGRTGGPGTPAGYGGGISTSSGTVTLSNLVVAENRIGDGGGFPIQTGADIHHGGGTLGANGPNLIGDNDTVESIFPSSSRLVGTETSPLDPRLAPLPDFSGLPPVRIPNTGSPVIEGGDNGRLSADGLDQDRDNDMNETLPLDQRGLPRISGPRVDLGSVEDQLAYPALLLKQAAQAKLRKQIRKTKSQLKKAKRAKNKAKAKKLSKKFKQQQRALRNL